MVASPFRIPLLCLLVTAASALSQAQSDDSGGYYTGGGVSGSSGGYSSGSSGYSSGSSGSSYSSSGRSSSSSGSYRGGSTGGQSRSSGGSGAGARRGSSTSSLGGGQSRTSSSYSGGSSSYQQSRYRSSQPGTSYGYEMQSDGGFRSSAYPRNPFGSNYLYSRAAYASSGGSRRAPSSGSVRGTLSGNQVRGQSRPGDNARRPNRDPNADDQEPLGGRLQRMRNVSVSGRLAMSRGRMPPEGVLVRLDCGRGPLPAGYTDANGYFRLQLGLPSNLIVARATAGTSRGFIRNNWLGTGTTSQLGCEIYFGVSVKKRFHFLIQIL